MAGAGWELRVEGGPEAVGRLRDELRGRDWHPHVRGQTKLSCHFGAGGGDEARAWGMAATRRGLHLLAVIEPVPESAVQAEARRLVALGHRVVELRGVRSDGSCTCGGRGRCRPGKHPRRRDWARGMDPADTRAGSNLGVVLGDLLVVDLDGSAAEEVLARMVEVHGPLPDGYAETRSGRPDGGRHLYFRLPSGMVAAAISGVEILAGPGHYAVVPPSMHVSGRGYAWVRPLGRVEDLPWAPAWLLAPVEVEVEVEAEPASEPWAGDGAGMLARAVHAVSTCPPPGTPRPDGRNTTLHGWAYTMGGIHAADRGPGRGEVEAALVDAARICGLLQEDGLGQCRASIASGWRAGVRRPLPMPATPGDPADIAELAWVRAAMEDRVWAGATGAVDYRVLDCILTLGEGVRRVRVRHSHRQVAERCSIPRRTVTAALRRLVNGGWLRVVEVGRGRLGTTWDVGGDISGPVGPRGGTGTGPAPAPRVLPLGHDCWTGMPAQAPLAMARLTRGPARTCDVADHTGVRSRQARRVLRALARVGLVVSNQGVWRLSDSARADMGTALDTAAETLGCAGALAAMCARHHEERVTYRSWWDGRERVQSRSHRRRPRWHRSRSESQPESILTPPVGARGPP